MWLSTRQLFLVTFLWTTVSVPALAQQTNTAQDPFASANTVAPAPRIEPLMTPREQMRRDAQAVAAQQGHTIQPTSGSSTTVSATNPSTLTPVGVNTMQNNAGAMMPVTTTQPQPGFIPNPPTAQMVQPQPVTPQATTSTVTTTTTPVTNPVTSDAAATTTTTITTEQPAAPETTNVQGFSGTNAGDVPITATGPVPNAGMDMNIDPNLVGGYDQNVSGAGNAVPYEVQLQERTKEIAEQARSMALEQATRSILPMQPNEIIEVKKRLKETQKAVQAPLRPPPKAGNVIRTVSNDPSEKPKTIHLSAGNVTTLNIIDITGEPWPIVDIGFGGNFDVKPPEPGGHVIRITPLRDYAQGNMVVRLLKMTTPITFTLSAGGKTVDYRFDARIPEYGPNAKTPVVDKGIKALAGDKITTSFLEGVAPTGSEKLAVTGVDGNTSAYRFAGALYVRTPLSLLSPAWQGSATSSDGMNVYVMEDAPVLLLSDKGNLVRARIGDVQNTLKE